MAHSLAHANYSHVFVPLTTALQCPRALIVLLRCPAYFSVERVMRCRNCSARSHIPAAQPASLARSVPSIYIWVLEMCAILYNCRLLQLSYQRAERRGEEERCPKLCSPYGRGREIMLVLTAVIPAQMAARAIWKQDGLVYVIFHSLHWPM